MIRSPLPWIGGKFYSRERILKAFPSPESYKTFVDVFGGAAHILLAKPPYNHLEVYNDYCNDLVNFWMQCRNHPEELQQQIDSLPYARSLYYNYFREYVENAPMSELERAIRFFYILRSGISGHVTDKSTGWGYRTDPTVNGAVHLRSATALFSLVAQRFRYVQIDSQDFERIIHNYGYSHVLLYCDPPYIGTESYYEGVPPFTMEDHERLAQTLNNTPAQVALSYYPHEALDTLYPISKWRRVIWQTYKHAEKTRGTRQTATELLLMNYPETSGLWSTSGSEAMAVS